MSLKKLDIYVDYIDWLGSDKEPDLDEVVESFTNASSSERIKMLLEMDEHTKEKIKTLMDGGII
jgi:hypothetical protein